MFLYFFPGMRLPTGNGVGVDPTAPFDFSAVPAIKASLADVINQTQAIAFERAIGTVQGLFVAPYVGGAAPAVHTYQPDKQTWLQDIAPGVWIGWQADKPPDPADLARTRRFGGYNVTDASGRVWSVPVARAKPTGSSSLPQLFEFDPITFEPRTIPNPEFDSLWQISGRIYDHWNGDEVQLSPQEQASYALQALMVNYRVGPVELNAFNAMGRPVLNELVASSIGLALIDLQQTTVGLPAVDQTAKQKKTELTEDPSDSETGLPDEIPDTVPAAAT
jgi:hypothetical protein